MTPAQLLAEAARAGISVAAVEGQLRLRAAAEPNQALVTRLREAKSELIELLRAEVEATPLSYPPGWEGWPDEQRAASILPDPATAPLAKCRGCKFIAPLSAARLCGRCIFTGAP